MRHLCLEGYRRSAVRVEERVVRGPEDTKPMTEKIIRYRLEGMPQESGHMRFGAFLTQLQFLSSALNRIDSLVSRQNRHTAYYQVIDLRHSSPAELALKAVPIDANEDYTEPIVSRFVNTWNDIVTGHEVGADIDRKTLEAFQQMIAPLGKEFKSATIIADDYEIPFSSKIKKDLDTMLSGEATCEGSVEGRLEAVNFHDANKFTIYPMIGPSKVTCNFSKTLRKKVREALDRRVNVTGILHYKTLEKFPHAIDVDHIEIYPQEEKLPHLADLRGIAPNATGDFSSVEYVRQLRNEWQ